jgi:hypothetical protein
VLGWPVCEASTGLAIEDIISSSLNYLSSDGQVGIMKESAQKGQNATTTNKARPKPVSQEQPNLERLVEQARGETNSFSSADVLQLQRIIGNRAVTQRMAQAAPRPDALSKRLLQRDDTTTTSISETTDTGNKYTQDLVHNKSKSTLTVQLGVNWEKKGTWSNDEAYSRFIRRVKTAAYGYLDNKFKVQCVPKKTDTGLTTIDLPIDFLIYDFDSGYKIGAHGGTPGGGSAMSQSGGNVYEYDDNDDAERDITYAHEFGHAILGASDEYTNPAMPDRVLTNDHSIMANYYTQGIAEAKFKARHFQHIVTEVAKAFAGYTCSIKEM